MIFLTSCFNKFLIFLVLLTVGGIPATSWGQLETGGPDDALMLESVSVDRDSPQAAAANAIVWSVAADGGIGEKRYVFEVRRNGGSAQQVQAGPTARWSWRPERAGEYRVRVVVHDAAGNRAESEWSEPFEIAPPLVVDSPEPMKPGPRMATEALLAWKAEASGGVGDKNYEFEIRRNGEVSDLVQFGPLKRWVWEPQQPGDYQVRVAVTDALGNRAVSGWSAPYRIVPVLTADPPTAQPSGPQMLGSVTVDWSATASGGVGSLSYSFILRSPEGEERQVQSGASPHWQWTPQQPGPHRVRVVVTDQAGHTVQSPWSASYGIAPPLKIETSVPGRSTPQAAQTVDIAWTAQAIGGVGEKSYIFELAPQEGEKQEFSTGASARWRWLPGSEGSYRVRAIVSDGLDNRAVSEWSEPYRIAPPLRIEAPVGTPSGPQVAGTVETAWTVQGSGGVGENKFVFEQRRGEGAPVEMQSSAERTWTWRPETPGIYQVRATLRDALGNQAVSPWSEPYEIVEPLSIESLQAERSSPQAAQTVDIVWEAQVRGGVGEKTYVFEVRPEAGIEEPVQHGPSSRWLWRPQEAGRYQVRVTVHDALDNQVQSAWSEPFEVAPPLQIDEFGTESDQQQFLVGTALPWNVQASGGVEPGLFQFSLQKQGGEAVTVQEGPAPQWSWKPREPGLYRVRVTFRDALSNQLESSWSPWIEIVGPLTLEEFNADLSSPQPALKQTIHWEATTRGGVGETVYEFQTKKDDVLVVEQKGPDPVLVWRPRKMGSYRLQVVARDAEGNVVESGWSAPYRIGPAVDHDTLIALLPVENLSGVKVPLEEIETSLSELLKEQGYRLLDSAILEAFMARYRMRYTGGIDSRMARKLKEETGTEAVFITSVESYQEGETPRISLISRLVLCDKTPEIAWIKSVGLTGIDSPGLLALGVISDAQLLVEKAELELLSSLDQYLEGREETQRLWYSPESDLNARNSARVSLDRKYRPRSYYRATDFEPSAPYSVAVVPFLNAYARKNAGFVVPLHLVEVLHQYENLAVFEPGVVRENLLKYRLIMPAGPSLAIADILASPTTLDADLILSGQVFDYQGLQGTPKVDFSVRAFDGKKREVVWWSRSYTTGDEGVYFFDFGRTHSAHGLANRMAAAVGALLFNGAAR